MKQLQLKILPLSRTINVMVMLYVMVEGGPVARVLEQLEVSEEVLSNLAQEVCSQLYEYEDEVKNNCINLFSSHRNDFSTTASKIQITCQTTHYISFSIKPLNNKQLVILVPNNGGYINYNIVNNLVETGFVTTDPNTYYTSWSTVLDSDGTPTRWRRGPNVSPHVQNKVYHVTIDKPRFSYKNGSVVDADFTWKINDTDAHSVVRITNSCKKDNAGPVAEKLIRADDEQTVTFNGLPLEDDCIIKIIIPGDSHKHNLTYHTICNETLGCVPLPEVPQDIYLDASEAASGAGWDIYVSWEPPARAPDIYNITLIADDVETVILSGNDTEVTFTNVLGAGEYNVCVEAATASGRSFNTARALFPEWQPSNQTAVLVAGAWCAIMLLGTVLLGAALWWRRRRANKLRHLHLQGIDDKLPKEFPESGLDLVEDSWEIRSERLLLHEVIGEGAFGVVRRGTLAPEGKEVAVKMLKDFLTLDEVRSFRVEMELMKSVGAHPHVVSLVGCCSGRRPLIVAEYCSRGDLLSFLRCSWDIIVSKRNVKYYNNNLECSDYHNDLFKSKTFKENSKLVVNKLYDLQGVCDAELSCLDLLSFCRQIAMGMEFLALNRVVHRDLAARNILVSRDRTLKIADFGLSRDVYQENQYKQKGNGKMPVKWMALESLTHRIYTTQSDVWSFGVVVWEVVTVGGAPYPEVPAARLPRLLRAGYRMPRPNNCSKQLYELILSCWSARPRDRPTFAELHNKLDELLDNACADEYLSLELEADDAPPTPRPQRYLKMILRGNRVWARGESYERPLKAPQSNHYTSPPAPLSRQQVA